MPDNDRFDADALTEAAREAEDAAQAVSRAFERTGDDIARSMERAARSGSLSMQTMVEDVLQSLARLALDRLILNPLSQQLAGITGQRAEGGPVLAGKSYLVGERGPEVFTPMANGAVSPSGAAPVIHITIQTSGDAASAVRRSEGQIAASLARAVRAGSERL